MNSILNLFNEKFVIDLFSMEILPFYKDFSSIKKIKIIPHKKSVWEHDYHVVIEFRVCFLNLAGKKNFLPIYCSAHSREDRKYVYGVLKYLWQNDFSSGYLTSPHPLFYSSLYNAVFYRGAKGNDLLKFIIEKDYSQIESTVKKSADWLAKLHRIPPISKDDFLPQEIGLEKVVPGKIKIFEEIKRKYGHEKYNKIEEYYNRIARQETEFLNSTRKRWVVHGDAHPENIIKVGKKKIAFIDFADVCLSDFARDVGSFLQQFEYRSYRAGLEMEFVNNTKKIFLEKYLNSAKIKLDDSLKNRINYYYSWTLLRTVIYFLTKHDPDEGRASRLLVMFGERKGIE